MCSPCLSRILPAPLREVVHPTLHETDSGQDHRTEAHGQTWVTSRPEPEPSEGVDATSTNPLAFQEPGKVRRQVTSRLVAMLELGRDRGVDHPREVAGDRIVSLGGSVR